MAARKIILGILAVICFTGAGFLQQRLNSERSRLGLTRTDVLENAPPVLAFTTVALGGFRGIIANILWIRASELQENGKYFEMVQLADWITKLQPHFTQVWVNQAWNMSYNVSVKFPDHRDRWLWVQRGIELLRDKGMKYNPHEVLMFRELAWHFQHKMGAYLDDAHLLYKAEWAREMHELFGGGRPNFDELLQPKTPEAEARLKRLREKYKMDPVIMKEVDDTYGPLEWRLPETHAIYWASAGLKLAKLGDKPEAQFITLRRTIYQPMLTAFHRGRFVTNRVAGDLVNGQIRPRIEFGPNLDMIPNVSRAYEKAMEVEKDMAEHVGNAHKNFLRDAVYFLYVHNREREANQWFRYSQQKYGDIAFPNARSVQEYSLQRIGEDVNETSPDRVRAMLEGMVTQYLLSLANGEDDYAEGLMRMARMIHANFLSRTDNKSSKVRMALPAIGDLQKQLLVSMLDPKEGIHPELQAALRTRLGLPAQDAAAAPKETPTTPNTPAPAPQPNAPANPPAAPSKDKK